MTIRLFLISEKLNTSTCPCHYLRETNHITLNPINSKNRVNQGSTRREFLVCCNVESLDKVASCKKNSVGSKNVVSATKLIIEKSPALVGELSLKSMTDALGINVAVRN